MNILTQYGKEIFALFVPIFTLFINKIFKNGAKICYGELHQYSYLINEPLRNAEGEIVKAKQVVHTKSYAFKNEGKEPATNVEIIFNYPPMYVNIWPSRHYTIKSDAEERQVMLFDYLAPHESIRCEVMSINTDLPALLTVRCKEGIARNITLVPQKTSPSGLYSFLSTIAVSGVCNFNLHCCCFPPVVVAENRLETFYPCCLCFGTRQYF
ncbi:hypothetical protein [Escherichia coli]|uniref:hypothetical protein n=1 Tax=Escherichia coli TaxID=562 RepID=UPI0020344A88|nr:hypothetical protein [Escherichia coli]